MSDLIKRSEDWLDYHKGVPWETDAMKLISALVKRVHELEQQLVSARREGWEQAKREIKEMVQDEYCGSWDTLYSTIAAMEYGGQND